MPGFGMAQIGQVGAVRATVGSAAPLLERGRPTRDDVERARTAEMAVL